jgi:hypothetical protein
MIALTCVSLQILAGIWVVIGAYRHANERPARGFFVLFGVCQIAVLVVFLMVAGAALRS